MNEDADVSLFVRIYIHVYVWVYTYVYVDIRVRTFPMQKILLGFYAESGCQIDVCGYYFAFFNLFVLFFFLNFFSIEKPQSFNCDCHNFYVIQPGWGFDILHVISIYKNTYIQKHIEIDC